MARGQQKIPAPHPALTIAYWRMTIISPIVSVSGTSTQSRTSRPRGTGGDIGVEDEGMML